MSDFQAHMLTYGKWVLPNGCVPPRLDYAILGRSRELPKDAVSLFVPGAMTNRLALSPSHTVSPSDGFYIIRPVVFSPKDATPAHYMAIMRTCLRQEGNDRGRFYGQSEVLAVEMRDWREHGADLVRFAAEKLKAEPPVGHSQDDYLLDPVQIPIRSDTNPATGDAQRICQFLAEKEKGKPLILETETSQQDFLRTLAESLQNIKRISGEVPVFSAISGVPRAIIRDFASIEAAIIFHPPLPPPEPAATRPPGATTPQAPEAPGNPGRRFLSLPGFRK